ncbi:MAG: ribonuclease HII [Candidatus Hodarchaeales archaeon]|jgi:ribonuclease HII
MKKTKPTYDLELEAINKGHKYIIGVDEAGRGPLMGPVVAAAVYIPDGFDTSEINDSKKLSSKRRRILYKKIINGCQYSTSEVPERIIDAINIREATKLAMRNVIQSMYYLGADFVLIDGNFIPDLITIPAQAVVGGDSKSVSIAAASIIAKVQRDDTISAMHTFYPVYNWKQNKGYGTKEHRDAIKLYGVTPHHRKSFSCVKEYINKEK